MAFRSLQFVPGLNAQFTPTLNRAGWVGAFDGDTPVTNLIRWPASSNGLPEVVGGWTYFFSPVVTLDGVCRGLHSWATLDGVPLLGAGTNERLYVCFSSAPYDITPVAHSSILTNPFATINTSHTVTVTDAGYTPAVGQIIEISGATATGGLTLNGEFEVLTVSAPTYTIHSVPPATSSAPSGGGTPTIDYLLSPGDVDQGPGLGWGVGRWNRGTWGTARPQGSGTVFPAIWEIDNWGEEMVAVRRGSTIYDWKPGPTLATQLLVRATPISGAPPAANGVIVSAPAQQMIAWGISIPDPGAMTWGDQDPMLIGWSDFSDYTQWFAASGNAAGSFRLSQGSIIMQILRSQGQMMVWTDTAAFAMQFLGLPLVYGFQQLGAGCGSVSPKAAVTVGSQAYWWSAENFFSYNGTVEALPCPVRDLVFSNVNIGQISKVCASHNAQFSEVQWEYPSFGSSENDSYVSFNYANNTWAFGSLSGGVPVGRTARIDTDVFRYPVAADALGNVWLHENGHTAGGTFMPWAAQSGYADMVEGEQFVFVDLMIPDGIQSGGDIGITVASQNYPNDTPMLDGPQNAGPDVQFLPLRVRSRQMAVSFANTNLIAGLFWRLGRVRVRAASDGRQ